MRKRYFLSGGVIFLSLLLITGCAGMQRGDDRPMTPGVFMAEVPGYVYGTTWTVMVEVNEHSILDITSLGVDIAKTRGIGTDAIPILRNRVLAHQTADVDAVVGATVTSLTFSMGVNEALGKAGAPARMRIGSRPVFYTRSVTENVDVLVMGSGLAGLSAAITAKINAPSARVVVIEKSEITGGSSRMSAGLIKTPYQNTAAERDNLFNYFMARFQGAADSALVRRWVDNIVPAWAFIEDVAESTIFDTARHGAMFSGISMPPRMRFFRSGNGSVLIDFLLARAAALDIPVLTGVAGTQILLTDGVVTGALAEGRNINYTFNVSTAVVIATGGHGYNPEMLYKWHGGARNDPPGSFPTHTGTGFQMAYDIGAAYLFKGGAVGSPFIYGAQVNSFVTGRVLIADDGTRPQFALGNNANETGFPARTAANFAGYTHPGGVSAVAFTEALTRSYYTGMTSRIVNERIKRDYALNWRWMVEKRAERPATTFWMLHRGDSVPSFGGTSQIRSAPAGNYAALAALIPGTVNATQLEAAFEYAPNWHPPGPRSPGTAPAPVAGNLIVAIRAVPGNIGTYGGLMIDEHSRVLRRPAGASGTAGNGRTVTGANNFIPGLYAAGEVANGQLQYLEYPGSGTMLSIALTFGHLAGLHIANTFNTR